ncbi:beta-1,4-glucuronosyltransferase WelK [Phenylobacterium sp.]|uniref:beta-1,4-glucuronosyltransferase WelK n=1 Tax=Phenylobacterium sp. TaxID=1871053 RepID=UPI0025F9FF8F|nr:glycosyltransferase [Phenylobacterium sp.]
MSAVATGEPSASPKRLRICLAASGGGHVRQLLDLQPVWSRHDYFFVTEDTALGQTLAREHRTHFVPHFAWGQAKLGAPFRMIGRAVASLFRSLNFMLRERPDLVISTGAGAVIFPVLWGRLTGAHVVVIESFARFEGPSLFGRIAGPLAHDMVVQSAKLAAHYPRARVFDPFRMLEGDPPPKQDLLFATVGATLPFDRLVDSVAALKSEGAIPERVIVQTGVGGHAPDGLEVSETLPFDEVQSILRDASIVVCHGGTGSLITALRQGCQVIAMPRLSSLGEHYDDHQAEITEAFAARGLALVANTPDELRQALIDARARTPVLATTDPQALMAHLETLIEGLTPRRR